MSQQQMTTSTEKYIKSADGLNNSTKIEKTTKVITTEETIKTKKYKYQFSNINKTNNQNNFKNNLNQNQKSNNNKLYETENTTIAINSTNNGKNSQNYAIENSNSNYRYDNKPLTESSNIKTNLVEIVDKMSHMQKFFRICF